MSTKSKLSGLGLASDPAISQYLKSIDKYDLLEDAVTKNEIRSMLRHRDAIVSGHLKLVVKIAIDIFQIHHWQSRAFNLLDLIQEGNVTILQCIDSFDPNGTAKFSTYLANAVRNNLKAYIREHTGALNLSKSEAHRTIHYNYKQVKDLYDDPDVSTREIADTFQVSERDIELIMNKDNFSQYQEDPVIDVYDQMLDHNNIGMAPMDDDGNYMDPYDVDADSCGQQSINPEANLIYKEELENLRIKIDEFRETLNNKQLIVFDHCIFSDTPQAEIASRLYMTPQSISNMKNRIMKAARNYFTLDDLKSITEV